MEERIKAIPSNESIFVLYRYNADCPKEEGLFRNCPQNVSLMTIHASKGLEARHVFVLFPNVIERKFPSEIEDHFMFNLLKENSDDYAFSEERRLMYVAITRAQQNLYFVSPSDKDPNSVFWDELKEMAY
jgi:DNA helicase-4